MCVFADYVSAGLVLLWMVLFSLMYSAQQWPNSSETEKEIKKCQFETFNCMCELPSTHLAVHSFGQLMPMLPQKMRTSKCSEKQPANCRQSMLSGMEKKKCVH